MAATDPYGRTWYAGTMTAAPERAPLGHDIDVDVCVVGGGLAGLTAAREIATRVEAALSTPFALDTRQARVGVSIGIAAVGPGADSVEVLEKRYRPCRRFSPFDPSFNWSET